MNKEYIDLISNFRTQIQSILKNEDNRLLVIVGPCSIHSYDEAIEYAKLLKIEQEKYKDSLYLVMRTYFQKPRTTVGWEGLSVDPSLDGSYDVEKGIELCRSICEDITQMEIPIADEALNMELTDKWKKYLSYAALGARNSEDQNMRKYCSGLNCPVGAKHPRCGSISDGVNAILSIQHSGHKLFYKNNLFTQQGNEFAHLILRGHRNGKNLSIQDIETSNIQFEKHSIKHPSIICDVSHDNTIVNGKKDVLEQIQNIKEIAIMMKENNIANKLIKGVMIESHINFGNQKFKSKEELQEGVSITDSCIDFKQTQEVLEILSNIKSN